MVPPVVHYQWNSDTPFRTSFTASSRHLVIDKVPHRLYPTGFSPCRIIAFQQLTPSSLLHQSSRSSVLNVLNIDRSPRYRLPRTRPGFAELVACSRSANSWSAFAFEARYGWLCCSGPNASCFRPAELPFPVVAVEFSWKMQPL
jgi:hypothetical protein